MQTLDALLTVASSWQATLATGLTTGAAAEPDVLRFLGRLHPLAVHFPVALILVALLFELPTVLRRGATGGGHSPFAHRCLVIGALAAAAAAWFGWLNADLEPHSRRLEKDINLHRWLGIATTVLALIIIWLPLMNRSGARPWASRVYRLGLILCAGTLAFGGHIGGELVFGEGYVLEPLLVEKDAEAQDPAPAEPVGGEQESEPDPASTAAGLAGGAASEAAIEAASEPESALPAVDDDRITFVSHIRPILAESCFHCHGAEKAKGGLRLHTKSDMFGPEKEWWVVVPGDVEASLLHELVSKPADDDELMPADDDPLAPEAIALIAAWIESGAEWGDESAAAPSGTERTAAAERAADRDSDAPATVTAPAAPTSPSLPEPTSVDASAVTAAVEAVRARGGVVAPIAQGSPALDVTYAVGGASVTDDALDALAGLEPVLAWLDLGRTSVTDAGVAKLAGHVELRRLHLERTAVTDACLDDLARFRHLRYLNLYGTAVTDAVIDRLIALEHLEQVYLWETGVTDTGLARLAEARPTLQVVAALDLPPLEETVLQVLGTPAGCCAEASAAGNTCDHECCIAAAAEGKVCVKCGGVPAPDGEDA